jgi:hypothetical protein
MNLQTEEDLCPYFFCSPKGALLYNPAVERFQPSRKNPVFLEGGIQKYYQPINFPDSDLGITLQSL